MVQLVDVNNPKERNQQLTLRKSQQQSQIPVNGNNRAPIPRVAVENIINYFNTAAHAYTSVFNIRDAMLQRDLAYYRENDNTRAQGLAKNANREGDTSKVQNVVIPVVMPQVESALAYHTSVFLTGYPIFASIAPPEQADAVEQMDTLIGENSTRTGWAQELMKTIRNGLKYDLGACEVIWDTKKAFNIGTPQISKISNGSVDETVYSGNYIKDLDPYNIILDTRVSPDRNHIEGEIAGYTELLSPVAMKQRMDELDPTCTMNFREAFNAPSTGSESGANASNLGYFTPTINPDALMPTPRNQQFNWATFFGMVNQGKSPNNGINYQASYEWTVLYVRLIPSVFGIPTRNANHVQIWKFIIVNRSVVIFAQQQTNAHNFLPIIVCKPSNDGLKWQSKSFAQNAEPYQYVASALTNSAIESQRRKVYDRIFYDPNRVNKRDIDHVSSVARIPVKNSQYNKDISSAIHVAPYRDEGVSEVLQFAQNVASMADIANGQNRVQQGQFQKGNKTQDEFNTTMQNANARQQMAALALEFTFFVPIKEIIKSNILQYQPPTTLVNAQSQGQVSIDPTVLRKAMMSFKISDGLLPTAKMISSDMFTTMLQAAQAMPELNAEYDLLGMFVYQMKMKGVDWLDDFKRTPQQQQQQMQLMQQAAQATGKNKPQAGQQQQGGGQQQPQGAQPPAGDNDGS
jgi:hypothetical protein